MRKYSKRISIFSTFAILFVISSINLIPNVDAQDVVLDENKIKSFLEDENYEELLSYVDYIILKNPQDEIALYYKGLALFYLERDVEALENYDKALEINPENAEILYDKARALFFLDRYDEALVSIDKTIEINPEDASALNEKGFILYFMGNYEESIIYHEHALKIDPEKKSALDGKGNALFELGKIDEAIISYDKALNVDPEYEDALFHKGNTLYVLERFEEAIEYYDKVLEINYHEGAFNNRGLSLKNLGIYELGSTIFHNEVGKGIVYETFGPIINGNPTVCAVEFEDDDMFSKSTIDGILKETGYAVSEWETKLKESERDRDNRHIWEIDFKIISLDESENYDYSSCDVTIKFSDIPEEPTWRLRFLGVASPNDFKKSDIDVYYTQIVACKVGREVEGNLITTYWGSCYSDKPIPIDQLVTTVKHEFGHTLGLGHYYSDDESLNNMWANSKVSSPSIMIKVSNDNEKRFQIKQGDIEMIRSLYGEDGFLLNSKLPKVETTSKEKTQTEIPNWIRNNAKWWVDGTISDSDFTTGIQFLVKEGIIQIPETVSAGDLGSQEIPPWIKNNADWWGQGLISDDDFVKGIQYLVEQGIIQV